jgi:hypothetical protein
MSLAIGKSNFISPEAVNKLGFHKMQIHAPMYDKPLLVFFRKKESKRKM